jgi:hypothetical protein
MDTIETPDLGHLDSEQTENLNNQSVTGRADDRSGKPISEFMPVSHDGKEFTIKKKKDDSKQPIDGETMNEEFSTKSTRDAKNRGPLDHMEQGVLVNGSYIARKTVIKFLLIVLGIIIFVLFFIPPSFTPNKSECSCRYEDIFAEKGASQYKTDIMSTGYVYNIDAMSSDVSESYRICTVAFDVNNFLPIELQLKDFAVASGGDFKDHIVYVYVDNDAKTIAAMEKKTVKVNILINKAGLSEGEFDRAITSLRLTTKGMKKLGVIPCIPGFMKVSDEISFDPNVK